MHQHSMHHGEHVSVMVVMAVSWRWPTSPSATEHGLWCSRAVDGVAGATAASQTHLRVLLAVLLVNQLALILLILVLSSLSVLSSLALILRHGCFSTFLSANCAVRRPCPRNKINAVKPGNAMNFSYIALHWFKGGFDLELLWCTQSARSSTDKNTIRPFKCMHKNPLTSHEFYQDLKTAVYLVAHLVTSGGVARGVAPMPAASS
eukprot:363864-Chlamydomonas_euryale.AAC.15